MSTATTNGETSAPATTAPGRGAEADRTSVRRIVVRFTLATSTVLALVSLVAARSNGRFGPAAIGLLALLLAVQIPFVWQIATTLQASQRERDQLLRRAADTSQSVRRQLAADLHDGIVQDLSGVSYNLAALGRNESIDPAAVAEAAESLRMTLGSFRFVLDETLLDS